MSVFIVFKFTELTFSTISHDIIIAEMIALTFNHFYFISKKARERKENNELRTAEEHKEMLLQDIRRRSNKQQYAKDFELARKEKMNEYNKRQTTPEADDLDRSLVQVQEDLLKLFGKLKVRGSTMFNFITGIEQRFCQITGVSPL